MRGISSSTKTVLNTIVDDLFDRISVNLLGHIPAFQNKKTILFTSRPNMTLAHLFLQSMGNHPIVPAEQEVLKNLLSTTHDYIKSLKNKTKANLSVKR